MVTGLARTPSTVAKASRFSLILPAALLICFLLPFVTISCDSLGSPRKDITTMTGLEVMTGKTIEIQSSIGLPGSSSQAGHVDPEPLAALAFVAGVAALIVTFIPSRLGLLAGAAASAVAFIALLLAKFSIDHKINQPANFSFGGGSTDQIPTGITIVAIYQTGYWLALVLSAASAGVLFYLWFIAPGTQDSSVHQSHSSGNLPPT
jgi:hypothetical protein